MKSYLKKAMAILVAACLLVPALAGCGSSATGGGSKELNVICWSEYLPQSVLDSFEKTTGIKVNMTTYASPDEMLAKVKSSAKGTYDMLIGPGEDVQIFIKLGMLNKLDRSKLKNFSNINPTYLNKAYDPNNEYSVPYMGAGVLIAVDTDVIKDDIKTYQDLLNPAYKGQMVVIEDSRAMVGMALMANGYDINDTSDAGLAKAKDFLMQLKPNIKVFDGTSPKTEMINGECPIGLIYGAECALAMQQKPSIKAIYPEGGIYFGADNMVTFAGGKNTDNALKFIDYILDGTVSASITNTFPYTNPNSAAVKLLPDSYKNNPAMNVPDDVIARSQTTLDIGDASTKIDELWSQFKN